MAKEIQVRDTIKIIDILKNDVNIKTLAFLSSYCMYQDQLENMGEDIIDINSANASDSIVTSKHPIVQKEIKALAKLANKHEAVYIRFINF